MADSIVYEDTVSSEISQSEFIDKQWLYVNDNNNGSYSSQIQLDTTALSNSGAYLNYNEAFILLPLLLQIESTAATLTATSASDYIAALKSGYWNMIHSMTVEMNNNNIIQQTPFSNVFASFKNLTSWSENDLKNWGAVCGFRPDSANSWAYLDAAPANTHALAGSGSGLSNNRNAPYVTINGAFDAISVYTAPGGNPNVATTIRSIILNTSTVATRATCDVREAWNNGFLERQKDINYNPALTAANQFSTNQGLLMSGANCGSVFRTYSVAAANVRYYQIDAVIRLKDYADFFNKVGLMKGASMKIYLNTNQCYFSISQSSGRYDATPATFGDILAQPLLNLGTNPTILGGGGTNPIMYSSNGLGQGASVLTPFASTAVATAVVNVAVSIVKTQFSQMTNTYSCPITSVRLYVPAYVLNPLSESRLLSLTPTKRIVYNDIFQFSFPNQNTNSAFNILVTNGCPNLRSILVIPMLPAASNGTAAATFVRSSTLLSPFASTPSSPDPLIINNFQVQISGKNLFNSQIQWDYETFVEQLSASNQLNGGLTTGMSSGLISKRDFQSLYRYYYANCSRSLPSEEGVNKSVQIQGTIVTPLATSVDLMVFIEYEKSVTVDLRTGAILGV